MHNIPGFSMTVSSLSVHSGLQNRIPPFMHHVKPSFALKASDSNLILV
jgi:hypothetical protein